MCTYMVKAELDCALKFQKTIILLFPAWDLERLTTQSHDNGLFNTMTDLFPYLIRSAEREEIEGQTLTLFMEKKMNRCLWA